MFLINRYRHLETLQRSTSDQSYQMYREIQLLANVMNEVMDGWLMCVILVNTTLIQSFCITTTILSISKNEIIYVPIFFGTTGVFTGIAQAFITKQMAGLYEESKKTFVFLKNNLFEQLSRKNTVSSRRDVHLKRRIYKSCWMIKQKFGTDNFVDGLTPLIAANNGNNLTINFLLIK